MGEMAGEGDGPERMTGHSKAAPRRKATQSPDALAQNDSWGKNVKDFPEWQLVRSNVPGSENCCGNKSPVKHTARFERG